MQDIILKNMGKCMNIQNRFSIELFQKKPHDSTLLCHLSFTESFCFDVRNYQIIEAWKMLMGKVWHNVVHEELRARNSQGVI